MLRYISLSRGANATTTFVKGYLFNYEGCTVSTAYQCTV